MIKDRLPELIAVRKKAKLPYGIDDVAIPVEDGAQAILLSLLAKIKPLYIRIKELHLEVIELRKSLNQPNSKEKLSHRIDDIKAEVKKLYSSIQEVNALSSSEYHLVSHVAKTHHHALYVCISSAFAELSKFQADLTDGHLNYVRKELTIMGEPVEEEELYNLLDKVVFTKNYLEDTRTAKEQLYNLQQRHDAFVKLENSIVEVNSLFTEMSLLVERQGESIDRIENNIYETAEQVEKSKMELTSAQNHSNRARKTKIIIGIVVVVVVVIIILSVSL